MKLNWHKFEKDDVDSWPVEGVDCIFLLENGDYFVAHRSSDYDENHMVTADMIISKCPYHRGYHMIEDFYLRQITHWTTFNDPEDF